MRIRVQPYIEWEYPRPRFGTAGIVDRIAGPGATRGERIVQFLLPLVAALTAVWYGSYAAATWNTVQYVLCGVLAFDIVGGIVTGASSPGKRWFHRPERDSLWHASFGVLHLVHPLAVALVFMEGDLAWFALTGGYLLVGTAVILASPLHLRRPLAFMVYTGSLVLALYIVNAPPALEWFVPLLYVKLFLALPLREEPYRPGGCRLG